MYPYYLFAVSTLPLSVWLPDLISEDPWARIAGVIIVQTAGNHLQERTGSNYNVIDVTRDPKVNSNERVDSERKKKYAFV